MATCRAERPCRGLILARMSDAAVDRLAQLRIQIGTALGEGRMPESELAEFRFLWGTTPSMEKDQLNFTLRDIEEIVKNLRRSQAIAAGAGKIRRVNLHLVAPSSCNASGGRLSGQGAAT